MCRATSCDDLRAPPPPRRLHDTLTSRTQRPRFSAGASARRAQMPGPAAAPPPRRERRSRRANAAITTCSGHSARRAARRPPHPSALETLTTVPGIEKALELDAAGAAQRKPLQRRARRARCRAPRLPPWPRRGGQGCARRDALMPATTASPELVEPLGGRNYAQSCAPPRGAGAGGMRSSVSSSTSTRRGPTSTSPLRAPISAREPLARPRLSYRRRATPDTLVNAPTTSTS